MYVVDLHQNKETIETAKYNLIQSLTIARKSKEKTLCLIVGYGSTGGTHKIKSAILENLEILKSKKQICDYIVGSDIDIFSAKYQNLKKKELLDEKCKQRRNPGEIIVIL